MAPEMNYNDLTKLSVENKRKFAKEYSEGSKALEEFLFYLWENNINTVGCCKGHTASENEYNFDRDPYIALSCNNLKNDEFKALLIKLLQNEDVRDISIINDNYDVSKYDISLKERKSLGIYLKTPNTLFSSVFEDFYNILENSKLNNSHEEIFQTYDLLSDDKKEFFQSAVMLKNLESINNLTTLPYKKYYKYFSDRIDKLDVSLKGINVGFNNERMKEIEENDDSVELSTSAYKKLKNGKAYMLDENYNPIEVSEKEMEEKGFLEYEYYENFKHEFLEKNHNVFRKLLTFDKTKLNANEKNDE